MQLELDLLSYEKELKVKMVKGQKGVILLFMTKQWSLIF